jgi:hypothetical protein
MAAGYPASSAQIANDWYFTRGDGGAVEVFTEVPEVSDIVPGAVESPDIDVTHLRSDGSETKPGKATFATFTVNMNYVAANAVQAAMEAEAPSQTYRHYRVMDPTNTFGFQYSLAIATFSRTGFVVNGKIQCIATFKQSGNPSKIGAA